MAAAAAAERPEAAGRAEDSSPGGGARAQDGFPLRGDGEERRGARERGRQKEDGQVGRRGW